MRKHQDVMTATAYLQIQKQKPNKYRNEPVVYDGIAFDSHFECERYQQLKLLERAKLISNLELQPQIELQPAFMYRGKKIRAIVYIGDFRYVENGKVIIEDTKGFAAKEFKIKEKMLKYRYPDTEFRLIRR